VLSGEALLIVEGQERSLKRWDFVQCPPETRHVFVGAGDGACVILAAVQSERPLGLLHGRRGRPAPQRLSRRGDA
jgi:quercetin dioxygenase-like cupin family protein